MVRITVDGGAHIGTGFHIGDGLIVTARHVMRKAVRKLELIGEVDAEADRDLDSITREIDEQVLTVNKVYYHSDEKVDVAVLETDFQASPFPEACKDKTIRKQAPLGIPLGSYVDGWIGDQFVLSKVLVMGYPKVPWSQTSVLVSTEAEVNAIVQNVRVPHPYFIVSSTARAGFSGAPVISESGTVIGVIVEALYGDYKPEETGFNAAITVEPLMTILANRRVRPSFVADDIWNRFLRR